MSNGKGSKRRPTNEEEFSSNYDGIQWKSKNEESGVPNKDIYFDNKEKEWIVNSTAINGENTFIGCFKTLEEAEKVSKTVNKRFNKLKGKK